MTTPSHPAIIKARLRMRGTTPAQLSRELGLVDGAVHNVINGARSRRVEAHIAQVLGLPVEEVFPDRYPEARENRPEQVS